MANYECANEDLTNPYLVTKKTSLRAVKTQCVYDSAPDVASFSSDITKKFRPGDIVSLDKNGIPESCYTDECVSFYGADIRYLEPFPEDAVKAVIDMAALQEYYALCDNEESVNEKLDHCYEKSSYLEDEAAEASDFGSLSATLHSSYQTIAKQFNLEMQLDSLALQKRLSMQRMVRQFPEPERKADSRICQL